MGVVRAGAGESDTLAFGPAMRRTQRVRAQSDAARHVGPQVALYACVWRQKLTRADKGIKAGQGVPRRRERKCTEWSGGGDDLDVLGPRRQSPGRICGGNIYRLFIY